MEEDELPKNQLIPNRGILSKINPVVRKKSHQAHTQVPSEWEGTTAQAYRLLVGPKINEYITEPSETAATVDSTDVKREAEKAKADKLFSKLVPSRISEPVTPFHIKQEHLDSLYFPNDLLIQVFPPGYIKKFDLLDRKRGRSSMKIIKPKVDRPMSFSSGGSSRPATRSSMSSINESGTTSHRESARVITDLPVTEEEEIIEQVEEKVEEEPQYKVPDYKLDPSIRIKLKGITRLRTYFYVIRCWARYKINARIKAAFAVDIHHVSVEIHTFKTWHEYVVSVKRLRECKSKCTALIDRNIIFDYFSDWKLSSAQAIKNASAATAAYEQRNKALLRLSFHLLHEATHSRRICRREINKFFRYKPSGPFTDINNHYTQRRTQEIRIRHFHFVKSVPPILRAWNALVLRTKRDNEKTAQIHQVIKRLFFRYYFEAFQDHFHQRIMVEVRKDSLVYLKKIDENEKELAEKVEKTIMIQLIRDRNILNTKLNQFDRLSQNHSEAIMRREGMRSEILNATNEFFKRQEELQLIDFNKHASDVERKAREVRLQLAEGFLYHLGRAVRSYDNQVIAHEFCLSFRILSQPVVERAVGYFYEKRHIKGLLSTAVRERKTLQSIVRCAKLYHQNYGWEIWKLFMEKMNSNRSEGLMATIRRRTQIVQLYPYFNWTEVLPVRPPRPLKEVEQMFKDLPLVSIQRKVARERVHHVNVKTMLNRRRTLRDFLRAYAQFVQIQTATREVFKLMRKRQHLQLLQHVFDAFRANCKRHPLQLKQAQQEEEIEANIQAWERHFFRERQRQTHVIRKTTS